MSTVKVRVTIQSLEEYLWFAWRRWWIRTKLWFKRLNGRHPCGRL